MEPRRRVRAERIPPRPPPRRLPSPAPPPSSAGLRAFVSGRLRRGACPPPHAGLPRPRSSSLPSLLIYSFPWAASLKVQSLSACASPSRPPAPLALFPAPLSASPALRSPHPPRCLQRREPIPPVGTLTPASFPGPVSRCSGQVPPGPQDGGGGREGTWGLGVPGVNLQRGPVDAQAFSGLPRLQPGPSGTCRPGTALPHVWGPRGCGCVFLGTRLKSLKFCE